jgi:hypothetical protein
MCSQWIAKREKPTGHHPRGLPSDIRPCRSQQDAWIHPTLILVAQHHQGRQGLLYVLWKVPDKQRLSPKATRLASHNAYSFQAMEEHWNGLLRALSRGTGIQLYSRSYLSNDKYGPPHPHLNGCNCKGYCRAIRQGNHETYLN